jgi:hypothetical protein
MAYTTINKSTDYFNTKLYTGTGSSNAITGVGFAPNWVWLKRRDTTGNNYVFDTVRGATQRLITNDPASDAVDNASLTAFGSDGFTVNTETDLNANSGTFVSWNWKANGAGSANTAGSINSTVSASATSGFSIVSYTGTGANATVGHGLSSAPSMIIVKGRDFVDNWGVFHSSLGNNKKLKFNLTNAVVTTSESWNSTSPTSSVFSVGIDGETNNNGSAMIAYCFSNVQGYSKFGSYVGNGNADGTFVYTGFKPAFILIKRYDGADTWTIYDNKRTGFNVDNNPLFANATTTESTDDDLDILSNGFKIRRNSGRINTSGGNQLYMAFAEAPLVGSNNVPTTAR